VTRYLVGEKRTRCLFAGECTPNTSGITLRPEEESLLLRTKEAVEEARFVFSEGRRHARGVPLSVGDAMAGWAENDCWYRCWRAARKFASTALLGRAGAAETRAAETLWDVVQSASVLWTMASSTTEER
jgi:hypothetical protein